jgi:hypothetical protein
MLKILYQLLGTKGPERPLVSNYIPYTKYPITPEFQEWCKTYNVSCLADRQSTRVEIVMGNTIKIVDLQSICHS